MGITSTPMPKSGRFFFFNTGADSRWAWGGTLTQSMEKVIAEMPWHFASMADEDDVLYFPKRWPKVMALPHSTLGLPLPMAVVEGLSDLKIWTGLVPQALRFQPFSWDEESLDWARRHIPDFLGTEVRHLGSNLPHPAQSPFPTLRHLNGRSFSLGLEKNLPGEWVGWNCSLGCSIQSLEALQAAMLQRGWTQAMLKGENGQAGNANVHVKVGEPRSWQAAKGILHRCRSGVLEEWHAIQSEYGFQYQVDGDGTVHRKLFHRMLTTGAGHFLGVLIGDTNPMAAGMAQAFEASSVPVAAALHAAGYSGHVGQDGYVHLDQGQIRYRPLSDLNVRMTMATPAHELCIKLRRVWDRPDLKLAWLFLPAKYRLSKLSPQERQDSLGEWSFDIRTQTGALWLTPCEDAEGKPVERHSLLLVGRDLGRLENAVNHFRTWALSTPGKTDHGL
jgi:hypothetical protein